MDVVYPTDALMIIDIS